MVKLLVRNYKWPFSVATILVASSISGCSAAPDKTNDARPPATRGVYPIPPDGRDINWGSWIDGGASPSSENIVLVNGVIVKPVLAANSIVIPPALVHLSKDGNNFTVEIKNPYDHTVIVALNDEREQATILVSGFRGSRSSEDKSGPLGTLDKNKIATITLPVGNYRISLENDYRLCEWKISGK